MAIRNTFGMQMSQASAERDAEGRKYTVKYRVETDTQIDGPYEVLELANLPHIGQPYRFGLEFDNSSLLKRKTARMLSENTEHFWEVTCEYEPFSSNKDSDNPVNPEDEPPEVEVGFAQFTRPAEQARFMGLSLPQNKGPGVLGPIVHPLMNRGQMGRVQNSAGDIFDPGIDMDDSRLTVRITRNELSFDPSKLDLINKINADRFTIQSRGLGMQFDRSEAKMQSIQSQVVSKMVDVNGTPVRRDYWRVSYEIAKRPVFIPDRLIAGHDPINSTGWHFAVLDRGFRQAVEPGDDDGRGGKITADEIQPLNAGTPASVELIDCRGSHFSSAQMLDGHGKHLGRIPKDKELRQPFVYSLWQVYEYSVFGPLNL